MAHIFSNGVIMRHDMGEVNGSRTYLVVIDETPESEKALRFAARLAAKTNGCIEILSVVRQQDFVAWGAVQATIEAEAREHAEDVAKSALEMMGEQTNVATHISLEKGDPVTLIRDALTTNPEIAALVLGAASSGAPGPLVTHFAGTESGTLPCPVIVVPGSMTTEAIDKLS
jgi:nucleotide-binding universal stress UspA family protein